jgi:hypothetical protein
MAYSDFTTLTKVRESFGLTIEESIDFKAFHPIEE